MTEMRLLQNEALCLTVEARGARDMGAPELRVRAGA